MNIITRAEISTITSWTVDAIRMAEKRLGFDRLRLKGLSKPVLYQRKGVVKILREMGFDA